MIPRYLKNTNLSLISLIILLFWMSLYVYVPVLPVYAADEKGASLKIVGLIVASYGLSQLLLRVPCGFWSDRLRKRKPFVALGLALSIASGLGLALAPTPLLLIMFRTIAGAAAGTWTVLTVWFASFFPPQKAVKAIGFAAFLNGLGTVLASGWGGGIAERYGWLAPFYVAAAIAAVGLIILPLAGDRRDGESVSAVARLEPGDSVLTGTLLTVSLAAAVGQFATYATTYGFIPIFAKGLGASPAQLGWLTSAMQIANVLASMGVGLFITSRSEVPLALVGLIGVGGATLWVLTVHSIPALYLTRVIHGLGLGLSFPILMGLAIKQVPGGQRALAMGIFQAVYALGMFAGPALSGWIAETRGIPMVFLTSGLLVLVTVPFLAMNLKTRALGTSAIHEG
jgi:MFS family permease